MTTAHDIDLPAVLAERLTSCHPDVLRELLATFIHTLMGAEADALCGAGYGERSAERTNSRNGYRHRQFDTRTGTLDLAIPKLRQGSYFPDWLLERRKRAERALTTVVAMRMVGVLLVSAMIVIPTLTGFALGRSFRQAMAIAIAMALCSVVAGLIAAYYLRLAAGGAIVLAALVIFASASLLRRGIPRVPRPAVGLLLGVLALAATGAMIARSAVSPAAILSLGFIDASRGVCRDSSVERSESRTGTSRRRSRGVSAT